MNSKELELRIDKTKSLLETLPENTIINRKKKLQFIEKEIAEIESFQRYVLDELKERFTKIDSISENEDLIKLIEEEKKLAQLKKMNNYNTPYEKMHLDYYLYQLHRYYKEDLNSVNACINSLLKTFSNVGIVLSSEDFYYHPLAKEYMNAIITRFDDLAYIHNLFEQIYWKCSDIVKIIERNFKSLYYKNLKKIESFYSQRMNELLSNYNEFDIDNAYDNIAAKIKVISSIDRYTILQKMINKDFLVGDVSTEIIEKKKDKIFYGERNYSINILEKLSNSLLEYDYYIKYQYIIEDMRKRLEEKEQHKGKYVVKLKEIETKEKELVKLNVKTIKNEKTGLFGKISVKKDEKLAFQISDVLKDLETLYNDLDDIKYNELIFLHLTSDTYIVDALKLASSNYLYFVKLTKEKDSGRNIKDITEEYNQFYNFMYTFSFTILNNIHLLEEKNIPEVISDHYKMYNVALEISDLEYDSFSEIKKLVDNLIFADNISRTLLKKEDIEFYLEMRRSKLFE